MSKLPDLKDTPFSLWTGLSEIVIIDRSFDLSFISVYFLIGFVSRLVLRVDWDAFLRSNFYDVGTEVLL